MRVIAHDVEVAVVHLNFNLWPGPPLGMGEDCNKRGGRVVGDAGEMSCAEVEIVKRLRRAEWDAWWVQAFPCGRARWTSFIGDVTRLTAAIRDVQLVAGAGRGHPDVIASRQRRVIAIECKSRGDRLRPGQIEWFTRALAAGIRPGDVGVVEWTPTP
jgi:hypothetical protein